MANNRQWHGEQQVMARRKADNERGNGPTTIEGATGNETNRLIISERNRRNDSVTHEEGEQ